MRFFPFSVLDSVQFGSFSSLFSVVVCARYARESKRNEEKCNKFRIWCIALRSLFAPRPNQVNEKSFGANENETKKFWLRCNNKTQTLRVICARQRLIRQQTLRFTLDERTKWSAEKVALHKQIRFCGWFSVSTLFLVAIEVFFDLTKRHRTHCTQHCCGLPFCTVACLL